MIAQFWYATGVQIQEAPLEEDGVLVWVAAVTHDSGEYGDMVSMNLDTARKLRDQLTAVIDGIAQ